MSEANLCSNTTMKNKMPARFLATAAVALVALSLAPLEAQARGRATVVHGARGRTYERQVHRSPGSFSASESVTLRNGKTATRSINRQRTDTGSTTSASATGFNGRTRTYDSTTTRTDSGRVREATATGPNGGTVAKDVVVTNQDGVHTRSVTVTRTPPQP